MEPAIISSADWSSVLSSITGQISVENIVATLGTVAGACVGLVFMWWGVRKGVGAIMGAFRNGRLPI